MVLLTLPCNPFRLRFSQCDLCCHFKDSLANAKNLEEKLGTLIAYRRHLAEQYQDRTLLWTLQESSLDSMSDVVVMQLDGMDQGKFRLPRDPRLRSTASLNLAVHILSQCCSLRISQNKDFNKEFLGNTKFCRIHEHNYFEKFSFFPLVFMFLLPGDLPKRIILIFFQLFLI